MRELVKGSFAALITASTTGSYSIRDWLCPLRVLASLREKSSFLLLGCALFVAACSDDDGRSPQPSSSPTITAASTSAPTNSPTPTLTPTATHTILPATATPTSGSSGGGGQGAPTVQATATVTATSETTAVLANQFPETGIPPESSSIWPTVLLAGFAFALPLAGWLLQRRFRA